MATGSKTGEGGEKPDDIQAEGESAGIPAAGELDSVSYQPSGGPGIRHWQASLITRPGIDDRSTVFFAAVEMTRMPMAVADARQPDNPLIFVNRAFLDLTGYTEAEVLGRNCRFLQGEQTDPRTVDEIRIAIREQRAVAVDILNYKAGGTPFWNALLLGPIFDEHGSLLYWFASFMDVTLRREAEQAIVQAERMEALGQLAVGLAHDFNNLLQLISGNLELAGMHAEGNDPLVKALAQARQATSKGGMLMQQLLSFARRQYVAPVSVDLNTLVRDFSEILAHVMGGDIVLQLDLQPDLPQCCVDPIHAEMALLNLLFNARDAMPQGGIVRISTALIDERASVELHHLPATVHVALSVVDQGEGMAPEVLRRATDPFFTTKGKGTGLGLAMVHGFVRQSKGKLEIDSAPGKGSAVNMIFPVDADGCAR